MLQSIKKTANGLVALFKDGTSYKFFDILETAVIDNTALPATTVVGNITSLNIPSGKWYIEATGRVNNGASATTWTDDYGLALSTNSSNVTSATGLSQSAIRPAVTNLGMNAVQARVSRIYNYNMMVPVYLNHYGYYSSGAPVTNGAMIRAIRIG